MEISELELVIFLAEQRGWDANINGEKLILKRESVMDTDYECELRITDLPEMLEDMKKVALDYDPFVEAEKEIKRQQHIQIVHINITSIKRNMDNIKYYLKQLSEVLVEELPSFRAENLEERITFINKDV